MTKHKASQRKASYESAARLADAIRAARGQVKCDLVLKGASYLDVFNGVFAKGDVAVHGGVIVGVGESYEGLTEVDATGKFVVPGFIDAHVHIESSLMTPARFQEAVLPCGTTTVIWDPHEIANVKGVDGIQWAVDSSRHLLNDKFGMDVFVMVPSCVPSTSPEAGLESAGAVLHAGDLKRFVGDERVLGLAEMMNFPGLLAGDGDILEKLQDFSGKRRDGHCPGLTGKDLNAYGVAGIHSCHESTSIPEAREKLGKGIHVLIREGSCAKDADELLPILNQRTAPVLGFCSDDRNPADIADEGHIDCIVNKALRAGHAPEEVFRAASFGPARAYGLEDRGAIAPGYVADFALVEPQAVSGHGEAASKPELVWGGGCRIVDVWKRGEKVDRKKLAAVKDIQAGFAAGKNMNLRNLRAGDFAVRSAAKKAQRARVIGVRPHQILTDALVLDLPVSGGQILADAAHDVLKIAVFERHHGTGNRSVAFVKGFGIRAGAIATSINHDSHNAIVVGSSDDLMAAAVNRLIEIDGGIVVAKGDGSFVELPLPLGGLMTSLAPGEVTKVLRVLKAAAKDIGCVLDEPFLQLSFLALPVIPTLKITDRGLVDVTMFAIVSIEAE
ncbi:MAG: adenine deaminase [Pseudomonadota bacterium]|jgi:adenine deaminase